MNSFPKSVLITQGELIHYAGSEIVTLELAEYFSQNGSQVYILTNYIDAPIQKEFQKLENTTVYNSPTEIDFENLDLIWVHHQLVPPKVLELAQSGKLKAKVIFHHMSPYHPLEFPYAAKVENYLADVVLFNSQESKKAIEARLKGVKLPGQVFNNPAPDGFKMDLVSKKYRKNLKNVLVVSNHVPAELLTVVEKLKEQDVTVRTYGLSDHQSYKRITPKDLAWADVVISIGKTVQYAIQSGTPVYCYDRFGGPGYLDAYNFTKAARLNLSGRGFGRKTAEVIIAELVDDYQAAQEYARHLQEVAGPEYLLSNKISTVLALADKSAGYKAKKLSPADQSAFEALSKLVWTLHNDFCDIKKDYRLLSSRYVDLAKKDSKTINELETEIAVLRQELGNVLGSASWRITQPLRKASKGIGRSKSH